MNGPVTVQTITLGNAISATKHVLSPLTSFAPHDTIYAVVDSKGSGKANLKANWTFLKAGKSVPVNKEPVRTSKSSVRPAANSTSANRTAGQQAESGECTERQPRRRAEVQCEISTQTTENKKAPFDGAFFLVRQSRRFPLQVAHRGFDPGFRLRQHLHRLAAIGRYRRADPDHNLARIFQKPVLRPVALCAAGTTGTPAFTASQAPPT